jgi:predicted nuclease of predicted toxin-antitoxin system
MAPIVVDENVSRGLAPVLRKQKYKVWAVAETNRRGISDELVWLEARKKQAILITRDYHFTNPSRFPPQDVFAIVYIRHGNLTCEQEVKLVQGFFMNHAEDIFQGRLVTLSPFQVTIR